MCEGDRLRRVLRLTCARRQLAGRGAGPAVVRAARRAADARARRAPPVPVPRPLAQHAPPRSAPGLVACFGTLL